MYANSTPAYIYQALHKKAIKFHKHKKLKANRTEVERLRYLDDLHAREQIKANRLERPPIYKDQHGDHKVGHMRQKIEEAIHYSQLDHFFFQVFGLAYFDVVRGK